MENTEPGVRSAPSRPRVLGEVVLLLAVVGFAFGGILPDFGACTDDLKKTALQHYTLQEAGGLGRLCWQIVFEGKGEGHYKPVQDVISAVAFGTFGPDGWGRAVMALNLVLHALTGFLLRTLMVRFGATPEVALFAALLFVAHPVVDSALVAVQFAPNVIGLFFLVLAVVAWVGRRPGAGPPGATRVVGASVALFASAGCNANFLATGPLMLAPFALVVAKGSGWRRVKGAFLALLVPAVATLAMLALRKFAYGALGSKVAGYGGPRPAFEPWKFTEETFGHLFRLAPTRHQGVNAHQDVPGVGGEDFSAALVSLEGVLVVFVAVAAVVVAAWLGRRPAPSGTSPDRFAIGGLGFGVLFLVLWLAPYAILRGAVAGTYNRYSHPAVAGLVVTLAAVVTGLGAATAKDRRRTDTGILMGFVTLLLLVILLGTSREAARSIAAGHRMVTTLVDHVTKEVQADPRIRRVYLLGYPRVFGRAGFTFQYEAGIRSKIRIRLEPDRAFDTWGHLPAGREPVNYHQALFRELPVLRGRGGETLPPEIAVYEAREGGFASRRLLRWEDVDVSLPDGLPDEEVARRAAYVYVDEKLYEGRGLRRVLASPSPDLARAGVESVVLAGLLPQLLREPLVAVMLPRPARSAASAYAGMLVPHARRRAVEEVQTPDLVWLLSATLRSARNHPELLTTCIERIERDVPDAWIRGSAALRAAVYSGQPAEVLGSPVGRLLTTGLDHDALVRAAGMECAARALLADAPRLEEARTALEAAQNAYPPMARGATLLPILLARCRAVAGAAPGPLPAPWGRILAAESRAYASRATPPAASMELVPVPAARGAVVFVRNESGVHFPGGEGALAAAVRVTVGETTRRYVFADEGIPPGAARAVFGALPSQRAEAPLPVRVTLEVLGHDVAREEGAVR